MKYYLLFIVLTFLTGHGYSQIIQNSLEFVTIEENSITISWENASSSNSSIKYGLTPQLELGVLSGGNTAQPSITIPSLQPASLVYFQLISESGSSISESDTIVGITKSLSSGNMLAYFNQPVDLSYASPANPAIHLPNTIDDTLVKYIERAEESIDLAVYNTTNSSSVANYIEALNQAFLNGVQVRVIYNENTGNTGIQNLHPDIPRLESPAADFFQGIGLMHHKFFVFDANSSNPNKPFVWTGSTNLTTQQINTDANNVIIIQDQSLAKVYTMEFEEMWGGSSILPNSQNSRFGQDKKDDTPHFLQIGDSRVECYFSPSDGTNQRILKAVQDANDELAVNTMLITRNDITSAINFKNASGSNVAVLVNSEAQTSTFESLQNSLHGRLAEYTSITGTLHHKLMIANFISNNNPFVLTGSHNWSASAEERNDENTLIIFNDKITNQYYQEFMARYTPMASQLNANDDAALVVGSEEMLIEVGANDSYYFTIKPTFHIVTPPENGNATANEEGVFYTPNSYVGLDSLKYAICNETLFDFCDEAWLQLTVDNPLSTMSPDSKDDFRLYPNPSNEAISVDWEAGISEIIIYSLDGKVVKNASWKTISQSQSISISDLSKGIYSVLVHSTNSTRMERLVIN